MYSVKQNIQQLTYLMVAHNVRHIVIAPGSRNMPLAQSFASHPHFQCYPVTDERSAGFFAVGLAEKLNAPVAVCCTSGSALLNLASAVSEAFYQQLPLLVVSADRPEAWIGQMDGQTLTQTNVFGNYIRKEVTLPEPHDEESVWHCNRLINEALLELQHHVCGPVHINVPVTEPFFDCSVAELPHVRVIRRDADYIDRWKSATRPLIIVGQMNPTEAQSIAPLLHRLNCPVFAEHLSNLPDFDNRISSLDYGLSFQSDVTTPDLVIYIGGHIVSKRVKKWIRNAHPSNCWRVSANGEVVDLFQCLTDVFEQTNPSFLKTLPSATSSSYSSELKALDREARVRIDANNKADFTSSNIVRCFMASLPQGSTLHLANSSAVRLSQLFPLKEGVRVYCNRGINGIDGSLSAAVAQARLSPDELTFLLIGDLSFFYDMNALWSRNLTSNLRILLINNGGGEIFKTLPGLECDANVSRFVCAQHTTTAKDWAATAGLDHHSISSIQEMPETLIKLTPPTSDRAIIVEALTPPQTYVTSIPI